jgi:phosphoribosylformylglycinamidine (FGAM) synthase-like enzyme
VPVVGGNVSLYNESRGTDIHPTPVIGVLGVIDELTRRPPGMALVDGCDLLVVGPEPASPVLAGSRWAWERGERGGSLPPLDPVAHLAVAAFVRVLVNEGLVAGVHDVAEGGLAVALAEAALAGDVGAELAPGVSVGALFGESPSRVLAVVTPDRIDAVRRRAEEAGVPLRHLGRAGSDRLVVDGVLDVALSDVHRRWHGRLPEAFGTAGTH